MVRYFRINKRTIFLSLIDMIADPITESVVGFKGYKTEKTKIHKNKDDNKTSLFSEL